MHLMRKVLRKYTAKKSGGYDGWILQDLEALPNEILEPLLAWLHLVEQEGKWPEVISVNLMALLPKPGGDRRTVAKTVQLYRLWCCCRKQVVQAWEQETMPEWDTCRPGFSALTAGLLRAIDVETTLQVGEHVVVNL